jgi:hypothetical protein
MSLLKQSCPQCRLEISFDDRHLGRKARCKTCGKVFTLQPVDLEDSVAGWLLEDFNDSEDASAPRPRVRSIHEAMRPGTDGDGDAIGRARPATPADSSVNQSILRLSHVDTMGAFFLFPPTLLYDAEFRASMPRHCLGCGATHGLNVHLLLWAGKLPHRDRLRVKAESARVRILPEVLMRLDDQELLEKLPRVANLPEPFCLPTPYFVCNRCSPAGQVFTHVRPVIGGGEACELGIACLKRAAEFLAANVGRDSDEYRRLIAEDTQRRKDPWNELPLSVRNRISQWYRPLRGEQFVAFVRDHDFAPTETGQGGLVLTNRRMIIHKYAAHREIDFSNALQLQAQRRKNYLDLHVGSETVKPIDLHCDFQTPELLRKALKGLGAKYTYKA